MESGRSENTSYNQLSVTLGAGCTKSHLDSATIDKIVAMDAKIAGAKQKEPLALCNDRQW
jgi:hypothetical protein